MIKDILALTPLLVFFLLLIGIYILKRKMYYKKVHKSILNWAERCGYELIDFKLDNDHTGPFMYDEMDEIFMSPFSSNSTKNVYIVNYKDKNKNICSGYILYGKVGLGLSGSNIVFEPIKDNEK